MRRQLLVLGLLAAAWPSAAAAQYVSTARGPIWDRFTLEPYAGLYYDNAGTSGSSFTDSGWMGGLRLGLALTDRARLIGDVGYAQVDDVAQVGTAPDYVVFGSQNWLVTGGVELDVVPGDTRASLSLLGGSVWRDLRERETIGQPGSVNPPPTDSRTSVLVPGFSIRQSIAPRADLKIGIQDYIFVGADPVSHNWALTAGVTLR